MAMATEKSQLNIVLEPLLVSAEDGARLLGISTKYFWQLDRAGKIPLSVNFGGRRKLWSVKSLDEFVNRGCPRRKDKNDKD